MSSNNSHQTPHCPMAVIGMGGVFAKSNNIKEYWRLLFRGIDGIDEVPPSHWSPDEYFDPDPSKPDHVYTTRGGFIEPVAFDPMEFGIPPTNLEATDTSQLIGLMAAKTALQDAGYGPDQRGVDRDKVSVVLGVTGTQELVIPLGSRLGHPKWRKALTAIGLPQDKIEEVVSAIADEYVPWQENSFPGLLGNVVAGRIANRLDFGGTNCVVDAACASSMSAINLALLELESGRSDMAITGGVDLLNDIFMHMCFAKTRILSATGDIRPFSRDADGTLLGEGVGIVVIKRLADAERDGDRVYAVIKAVRSSSDGRAQSIYSPRIEGQMKALSRAYEAAGVPPETIRLIEAHGTGTRVGDAVEFQALTNIFGAQSPNGNRCAVGSVKSMIGHAKAAAGVAGLIKTILAIHHKVIPPTLKADTPDPNLNVDASPFYISTETRPWIRSPHHPRRAGVSAFGFGGSNFHAVLEEYTPEKSEVAWDGSVDILAVSAATPEALRQTVSRTLTALIDAAGDRATLASVAAKTRNEFNSHAPCRFLAVLDILGDLPAQIQALTATLTSNTRDTDWHSGNAWYGMGDAEGPVAFLFPGQGSQYVAMGRDLVCVFPEALASVETMADALADPDLLGDRLYPRPAGSDARRREYETALRRTDLAQPAIGAVSRAMARVLERFGVHPDVVAGHSYGELTALWAAGRLSDADFQALSATRGRLMAAAGNAGDGDPGAMAAVKAPLAVVEPYVAGTDGAVVIANRNCPTQWVLSGATPAIDAVVQQLATDGIRAVRLPVAAAFHSDRIAGAQAPFADAVGKAGLGDSRIPVYANATGVPYPTDTAAASDLLGRQMASPVHFLETIENLYQSGVRTFVEVGPKAVLSTLVRDILGDRPSRIIATDGSAGRGNGLMDLARVLCAWAASGRAVDLTMWETAITSAAEGTMQVPLTGANYRTARPTPPSAKRPSTPPSATVSATTAAKAQPSPARPVHGKAMKNHTQSTVSFPTGRNAGETQRAPQAESPYGPEALQTIRDGLKSIQTIQQQTARAHQTFLEAQAAASRALEEILIQTRHLSGLPVHLTQPAASAFAPFPMAQAAEKPIAEPQASAESPAVRATQPQAPALPIAEVLMAVVSDLTGYPPETLSVDMDIEADLGIDSIKRVEILSTLEERLPGLPSVSPEDLGRLTTLGQIVDYMAQRTGSVPAHPPASSAGAPSPANAPDVPIADTLMAVVSDLTGYPPETLSVDMDIEADLGIDSIKRVEILSTLEERLPGLPSVSPEDLGRLTTLGQIVDYMAQRTGSVPAHPPASSAGAPSPANAPDVPIADTLMAVVSDLTGYPPETLSMDMDIEADLGIDSIKRVEILSTLEERLPGLPSVSPEDLGRLATLGQIVAYFDRDTVTKTTPILKAAESETAGTGVIESAAADTAAPAVPLERLVPTLTVAPRPDAPTMDMPTDRPVWITRDGNGLAEALAERLGHDGLSVRFIDWDALDAAMASVRQNPPLGLILMAPADRVMDPLAAMPVLTAAFELARAVAPALESATADAHGFLATVTRLDGGFGFTGTAMASPALGGLAGLSKTAGLEWPSVRCLALDVAPEWTDTTAVADAVAAELLHPDPNRPAEIGLSADRRVVVETHPEPAAPGTLALTQGDLVVAAGGARGVTAEAVIALAQRTRATIALLGRSAEPAPEPIWLKAVSDNAAVKAAILKHQFHGKASPKAIEAEFRRIMANRDIQATLDRIRRSDATAVYCPVDITNAEDVTATLNRLRGDHGPIRALIHGAGVLADRRIVDKSTDQFQRVLTTKVAGLAHLLTAVAHDAPAHLVLFSSVSARMGNAGQVDYAMANEVLNKVAADFHQRHPACRALAINWGPWDGGMVTPALAREFTRRGVSLIPLAQGAEAMVDEMAHPVGSPAEVVIGGPRPESTPHAADKIPSAETPVSDLNELLDHPIDGLRYPVLNAHVIGGKPVVPLALITELLAHSALHDNPGLRFHGLDDLRVLKGIRLDSPDVRVRLMAGRAERHPDGFRVAVELHNADIPIMAVNGNGRHARATALLTDQPVIAPTAPDTAGILNSPFKRSIDSVYADILFHGEALQGIRRILGCSDQGIVAELSAAPRPQEWIVKPLRSRWIADPLALDAAFQLATIWCFEQRGVPSLPSYAAEYRQYRDRFPASGTRAVLTVTEAGSHKMRCDIVFMDNDNTVIARICGHEAVMDPALKQAFKQRIAA